MTLTTHAATGMLVAGWTNSPLLGFVYAFLSHYILDAIPHGDEFVYWRHVHNSKDSFALTVAATDVFILIALVLTVLNFKSGVDNGLVAAGVVGGIIPDIFITLHTRNRAKFREAYSGVLGFFQKWYHWFLKKHLAIHHFFHGIVHTPIRFRSALLYQCLFVIWFIYDFIGL